MKLFINEKSCEVNDDTQNNLKEIIASIEQSVLPEAHVITTIKLNGVILSLQDEKNIAAAYPFERIESLEILTADPYDLMLEGIENANDVLGDLVASTNQVIIYIRQGDINQANILFQSCLEKMQWFNDILSLTTKLANIDYSQIIREDQSSVAGLNLRLLNVYGDIIDAQKHNDWINLSDILEYEFIGIIKSWQEFIPEFLEYLKKHLGRTN